MKTKLRIALLVGILLSTVSCTREDDDLLGNNGTNIDGTNYTRTAFYINGTNISYNSYSNPFYTNGSNTLTIKSVLQQYVPRNVKADVTVDLINPDGSTSAMPSSYYMINIPVNTPEHTITYVHSLSGLGYGKKYLFHVVYHSEYANDHTQIDFYLQKN